VLRDDADVSVAANAIVDDERVAAKRPPVMYLSSLQPTA
jgi:hypothetical protein